MTAKYSKNFVFGILYADGGRFPGLKKAVRVSVSFEQIKSSDNFCFYTIFYRK